MELSTARKLIEECLRRMDSLYGQAVFDEWAILTLKDRPTKSPFDQAQGAGPRAAVVAYSGPRVENFRDEVRKDAGPLCALASARPVHEGDFEFALDAAGTHLDAFMRLGPVSYLVCNHTGKTMEEIRREPRWVKAQGEFFQLGEKFRADALVP